MPRKRRWSVFLSGNDAHTCTNVPLPIIVFAKLLTLLTIVPDPSDLGVVAPVAELRPSRALLSPWESS